MMLYMNRNAEYYLCGVFVSTFSIKEQFDEIADAVMQRLDTESFYRDIN